VPRGAGVGDEPIGSTVEAECERLSKGSFLRVAKAGAGYSSGGVEPALSCAGFCGNRSGRTLLIRCADFSMCVTDVVRPTFVIIAHVWDKPNKKTQNLSPKVDARVPRNRQSDGYGRSPKVSDSSLWTARPKTSHESAVVLG
jgi:hypothetical protein